MEATNGGGQMEGAPMSESGNSGPVMTPVVDFQPFHAGGKQKLGEEMVGHLGTSGYLYMVNHGITAELVNQFFLKQSFFWLISVHTDSKGVPVGEGVFCFTCGDEKQLFATVICRRGYWIRAYWS